MLPSTFSYYEKGNGRPMILLHGLMGSLSNWTPVVSHFHTQYRVLIPTLPIEKYSGDHALEFLLECLESWIEDLGLQDFVLVGNSLGGHLAARYAHKHAERVRNLILTGSSGLYENNISTSYPKRGNFQYIKERVAYTFYDPAVATDELIREIFAITTNPRKCLSVIRMAKATQRNYIGDQCKEIKVPTLIIWGKNDRITPPEVAESFHRLIPHSSLEWIDQCGHAPMMEQPARFNSILEGYLRAFFLSPQRPTDS
jgi:pimeloyl-ACP methyl ester carboxylesterase